MTPCLVSVTLPFLSMSVFSSSFSLFSSSFIFLLFLSFPISLLLPISSIFLLSALSSSFRHFTFVIFEFILIIILGFLKHKNVSFQCRKQREREGERNISYFFISHRLIFCSPFLSACPSIILCRK